MTELVEQLISSIPENAVRCRIHARHAKSVQDGKPEERTLTEQGAELCAAVKTEYLELLASLVLHFGGKSAVVKHSGLPRALITGFLCTGARQMIVEPRSLLQVGLKKIENGAWYARQKEAKATIAQMLVEVHHNLSLLDGQPYGERMDEINDFFTEVDSDNPVVISFAHEPEPTLWVLQNALMKEDKVGLDKCQAYVVFTDKDGKIAGIHKFCPAATL